MIYIDKVKLYEELSKEISDTDVAKVMAVFNKLPLVMEAKSGVVSAGDHFEIKLLNSKDETPSEEDILSTFRFETKIPGVDNMRVVSVELPKFDSEPGNTFKLKIEVFPFDLGKLAMFLKKK